MKKSVFSLFLLLSLSANCQQKIVKEVQLEANNVEIFASGIDDLYIEETTKSTVEITVLDSELKKKIFTTKGGKENLIIEAAFKIVQKQKENTDKFCVFPPNNVTMTVKIPKNKRIFVYGDDLNILSKNYTGDFNISINKGVVKLGVLKGKASISLFTGAVFAEVNKQSMNLSTKHGVITKDGTELSSPYKTSSTNLQKSLYVSSIHANVVLTTRGK